MWIIILIFLFLTLCWFLLAPLELHIDSRTPQASLRWITIGKALIVFEENRFLLKLQILFFYRQWDLEKLLFKDKKKKKRIEPVRKKRKGQVSKKLRKFLNLLKTFRVTRWQIAIDTGNAINNAWLYPLNFFPITRQHLHVNFVEENYVIVTIRNVPWKLAYAFLK